MEEVEEICDRIAIVAKRKLLVGSVNELRDIVREKEGVRYLLKVQDITPSAAAWIDTHSGEMLLIDYERD